jgi:hypothetical protein
MSSMSITGIVPVTECADALVVWVASTTVGAERARLRSQQSKSRGVFGVYAEHSQPSAMRVAAELRALSGRPDNETLVAEPHTFGVTHASKLLPRGARVVGWLEADGYRSVAGTPQPTNLWLQEASRQLTVPAYVG